MKIANLPASRRTVYARVCSIGLVFAALLSGCALPGQSRRAAIYDFGPAALTAVVADSRATAPRLVIEMIDGNPALDSTAMLYRLAYADSQQLHPYSLARWSMTPSQLLRQRLREYLGQRYTVLNPGDDEVTDATRASTDQDALTLRIELEEFSQLFSTPGSSVGLLRLRATVVPGGVANRLRIVQRSLIVERSAPSPDASGGARAMAAATDAAAQELDQWLQRTRRP